MEVVQKIANENSQNQDLQYDIEVAMEAIFDYIKHLMRDAQQKKAKEFAFSHISESVRFLLKDFSQKVLPVKFRELSHRNKPRFNQDKPCILISN